ncbi:hypothetical protein RZ54_03440 [Apilactobacillus kunkeei]|uniref:YczE/YyaS/YitT family protein n=1 Tax=Apilactobacillus kunkeei TaxID=148814 RepID=UPI0006C25256|nr:DUF6198 family protein [Apilactobacillus kunkeei]KOY72565.1 hypothetical protein RZ54_03440 [Apilactobacillus kunkeei]
MKSKMLFRIILYIIGLNVLALGTTLFACGKLGVSSLVSVPQTLSFIIHTTLGHATTMFFIVLVLIQLIIVKRFELKIVLQLVLSFVFGWLVDFYGLTVGLKRIPLNGYAERISITLLAILCTALGIFMMVKAAFVLIPADGFVNVISEKIHKPFGQMKFCFDASMIVITILLGLIFLHHITSIGIGTVLAVLFVGQMINLLNYITNKKA